MWDDNYWLQKTSERTGLSVAQIKMTPWGDLEEMMGITDVGLLGIETTEYALVTPDKIITREKFLEIERRCMKFLSGFYK